MLARRSLAAVLLLAALLAVVPAGASAAVRYAAPGAAGPEPCNPTPCALATAVNGAGDGDRVVIASGQYSTSTEIVVDHAADVGGEPGAARPAIGLEGVGWAVRNPGAVVHDLETTITAEAMAYSFSLEGGTAERIVANAGHGAGCLVTAGLLRDSLCPDGLFAGPYEPGPQKATLRNVTALPLLVGASGGAEATVDAANVIAHSLDPAHRDLEVDVSEGSSGNFVFTNSNYASVATTLSTGNKFTYTAPGTNGNQTAPPQFVDIATRDFRPLESSPTVDAGLSDASIGALDLAGQPRSLPKLPCGAAIPDIGAYEFVSAACPSNAFKFGKLKPNRKKGTATLTVWLPGPGTLALAGKGLAARKPRQVAGPGKATLRIAAKGKWKRKLLRSGKVKLRARITFTPSGGLPNTAWRKLSLSRARRSP